MAVRAAHHRYTFSDYLVLEESANTRHEFMDGEIYAMAGGTPEHAALAVAVSASLLAQLHGGPCRVYSSDMRIRVQATGLATYPDVTVVCGALDRDPDSATTVVNPTLVIEVTSDSTEAYDRTEKLDHYRRIPSISAVVLVSHRERSIQIWERAADVTWHVRAFGPGEIATVDTLPVRLVVDDIYGATTEPGS